MIVVMKHGASNDEVDAVLRHLEAVGLAGHVIEGTERRVVAVVGTVWPELQDELEVHSGVTTVLRVSKPYKLASREVKPEDTVVRAGPVAIGDGSIVIIAGPCTVESEEQILATARFVQAHGAHLLRGGAFKPRTNPHQFQGMRRAGLELLALARQETALPVVTEVMDTRDVELVARYADVLQIGARNAQNFALLEEVGRAQKPVLLKRGMHGRIEEWLLAAEYVLTKGNRQVVLCERGIRTFETATRNTMDLSAIPYVKRESHLPVIADPSHGTGKWYLVPPLAVASVAAGADGVMVEVHPNPDLALVDGAQSLTFENFTRMVADIRKVGAALGRPLAPAPAALPRRQADPLR